MTIAHSAPHLSRARSARRRRAAAPVVGAGLLAFASDHALGAIGIALAAATSLFAYEMVARGERHPSLAPLSPHIASVVTPWKKGIAPARTAFVDGDPMITGSIAPASARTIDAGTLVAVGEDDPAASTRYPNVPLDDYVLRNVQRGAALVESREGYRAVRPGAVLPGAGRVEAIERREAGWVVVTSKGVIDEDAQ